jgi:hypothetical protein
VRQGLSAVSQTFPFTGTPLGGADEDLRRRQTVLLEVGLGRSVWRGRPARKPHRLHTIALPAAVSNYVSALIVGIGPLQLHRLLANDARQQIQQRVTIIVHRCRNGNGSMLAAVLTERQ